MFDIFVQMTVSVYIIASPISVGQEINICNFSAKVQLNQCNKEFKVICTILFHLIWQKINNTPNLNFRQHCYAHTCHTIYGSYLLAQENLKLHEPQLFLTMNMKNDDHGNQHQLRNVHNTRILFTHCYWLRHPRKVWDLSEAVRPLGRKLRMF